MKMEKKMENLLKTEGISYMGFGIVGKAVMTDSVLTPEAKSHLRLSCFLLPEPGNPAFPHGQKFSLILVLARNAIIPTLSY